MVRIGRILIAVALACVLAIVVSFVVENHYASRAKLTQRVQLPDPSVADLFGGEPTMIGSPQPMIIEDPRAVLPGNGPQGSILVDDGYLKRNGQYPLQLKTVEFVASTGRLVAGGAALGLGLLGWWLGRNSRKRA